MNRETIYAAMFAKFAGITFTSGNNSAFNLTSRKLKHWDDVTLEQYPCLFQIQTKERNVQPRGMPQKWTLDILLYVYVNTGAQNDPSITPSSLLNPILDAIDGVLGFDDGKAGALSLGGLVSNVSITGDIETSEGNLGDLEIAVIPISIVVPSL